ncbi:MAG TPA: DUF885 domain-containing protein [Terriglobales bacterium]|jgi:uncharacterized protein (DUF885 family)|nr:DUF885 domain-containing protein [Terriglobales bacterium]
MTKQLLLLITMSLLFTTIAASQSDLETRRQKLRQLLSEEWEYQLRTFPELATQVGDHRYNDKLSDYSADAIAKHNAHEIDFVKRLEAIKTSDFPEQERLNQLLVARDIREDVDTAKFKNWEMPATQFFGPQHWFVQLATDAPFHTVKDYDDYLARLRQIPHAFDQVAANMRQGLRDHLMPPKYLLEKVAAQSQAIADAPLDRSPFTHPVQKFPDSIPAADQKRLHDAITDTVKKTVLPSFSRFAAFVKNDYAPHGRTDFGVWSLPDGEDRYRLAIRHHTTTNMSPEEVHEFGLKNVAEIEAEMLKIARAQGFDDLKSFNASIRKRTNLYATSGQQLLDLYQKYTDQMSAKLPELFGKLPKNKLVVVPMEEFRQADAVPADYSIGSGDGARPGRINVNEYAPEKRLLLNVEAIAYHEGLPGHHLQFSIAQELEDLPPVRKFGLDYNAFSEGWAFYSERLGKDVGFYQDPFSDYGRLQNEMWRAVRLVVDTGVHNKHWTRDQMVDYFREHTAMDEPNIQTEVDRYIAWPGQALAYKIGQAKILELRDRAKQALGPKFNIREFHDAVLDAGPLPMDQLEAKIDRWLAAQSEKAK